MVTLLKSKTPYILSCALLSSAVLLSTGCSSEEEDKPAEQSGAVSSLLETTTIVIDVKNTVEETAVADNSVVREAKNVTAEAVVPNSEVVVAEKVAVVTVDKSSIAVVDGSKIYTSCSGCHGSRAEGGVGPNLNAQSASDVINKLNRYKVGEQIGPMSAMMKPIAKELNEEKIQAVAEYIMTLK